MNGFVHLDMQTCHTWWGVTCCPQCEIVTQTPGAGHSIPYPQPIVISQQGHFFAFLIGVANSLCVSFRSGEIATLPLLHVATSCVHSLRDKCFCLYYVRRCNMLFMTKMAKFSWPHWYMYILLGSLCINIHFCCKPIKSSIFF